MTYNTRKKVRLIENERFDLPDALATADLRDAELQLYLRSLVDEVQGVPWVAATGYVRGDVVRNGNNSYVCFTAGTSAGSGGPTGFGNNITDGTAHWTYRGGTIFRGFTSSAGSGLVVNIANVPGVAIDTDGNLLLHDNNGVVPVNLADNTTNYVYAYYIETQSDSDARKQIDSVSGLEVSSNVDTRLSKLVTFVSSLTQLSQVSISGQTRALVPICTVITSGGSVSSVTDTRPLWTWTNDASTQIEIAALKISNVRQWLQLISEQIASDKGAKWWVAPTLTLNTLTTRFDVQHNTTNGTHENITGLSINLSGAAQFGGTLQASGLTSLQAGVNVTGGVASLASGAKFKASGSGSTTLDGYRTGNFTPVYTNYSSFLGPDPYINQVGHYARIGNWVFFHLFIDGYFTGFGQVIIDGLPYRAFDNVCVGSSATGPGGGRECPSLVWHTFNNSTIIRAYTFIAVNSLVSSSYWRHDFLGGSYNEQGSLGRISVLTSGSYYTSDAF